MDLADAERFADYSQWEAWQRSAAFRGTKRGSSGITASK